MKKRILGAVGVIAVMPLLMASSCSREVDISATGASSVPGASGLHRFCDGPVLIYFTKISGANDEYDWYWPGGCEFNPKVGAWVFANKPPTGAVPNGDSTGDS